MKKNFTNNVSVTGYLFDLGKGFKALKKNVTGPQSKNPGTEYIRGDVNIATDDKGMNVVTLHFNYVTATKRDGSDNNVYRILERLMEEGKTFEEYGTDATLLRSLGSVDVNDFVNRDGEMVSGKVINAGFISDDVRRDPVLGATFDTDMLIADCTERETEDDSFVQVRGYVFSFRKEAIPVVFNIRSQAGMDYFMGLDASSSNPTLTEVKGEIISSTIERKIEEEGAFGEPTVRTTTYSRRSWDITWAKPEPYEWDDESTLTKKEFKEMLSAREEKLAAEQKRHEEYLASRDGKQGFPETKKTSAKKASTKKTTEEEDDDDFPF